MRRVADRPRAMECSGAFDRFGGVPPHVSLLFPWRESPLGASDLDEVGSVVSGMGSFSVLFDGVQVPVPTLVFEQPCPVRGDTERRNVVPSWR